MIRTKDGILKVEIGEKSIDLSFTSKDGDHVIIGIPEEAAKQMVNQLQKALEEKKKAERKRRTEEKTSKYAYYYDRLR